MKNWLLSALLILLIGPLQAQYTKDNLRIDLSPEKLSMFTHDRLMIIPVQATPKFNEFFAKLGNFTVLKEAMASQELTIKEISASGTVNTLVAVNRSQDTIFGMAGEVVKGGKQDRVIAQNFLMYPGDSVNLSAFCVEQGRWSSDESRHGKTATFEGTKAAGAQSLRKTALKEKNQQAVWDKVAELTDKNDAKTSTGTYTALWKKDSLVAKINNYKQTLGSAFGQQKDVIGFIAITGDTVLGCDLFATHDLFMKSFHPLLEGYVTEAITTGSKVSIEQQEIEDYIDQLLASEEAQAKYVKEHGSVFEENGLKLQLTGF